MTTYSAFIGTYAEDNYGIVICDFDSLSGTLTVSDIYRGLLRPSYLCLSADQNFLYTCAADEQFSSTGSGVLHSFAIEGKKLRLLNSVPTMSGAPCYINVDSKNKFVFAASYREGSIIAYKLAEDGSIIKEGWQQIQHEGKGINPVRQDKAHAHCTELSPAEDILYAVDLGIDCTKAYRLNGAENILNPYPEADLYESAGSGPRHIIFSENGNFAYVINELLNTISAWNIQNPAKPAKMQTLSLLPESWKGENTAAAIKQTKDGKIICCSNRGYESLAFFAVDTNTGLLSLQNICPLPGNGPRDFAFSPCEKYIVSTHQYSDNVIISKFDAKNAKLAESPASILQLEQQPVCIVFRD